MLGKFQDTVSLTGDTVVRTIGPVRVSLASAANEFLNAAATFSTGTASGFGFLQCRRAR